MSTTSSMGSPEFQEIHTNITSKNEEQRNVGVELFKSQVEKLYREYSAENFSKLIDDIYKWIGELLSSRELNDRTAAIILIDVLIDIRYDDQRKINRTRFSQYLRNILANQSNESQIVLMVAKTFGKLARASDSSTSKTLTAEWVEFEIKRALEWLKGDDNNNKKNDDGKRYAAVFVLKELAENAPTLFYGHVQSFLSVIWNGLTDANIGVRTGSVQALHAVLGLISERPTNFRNIWYQDIYNQTNSNFKNTKTEVVHGALLAIGELLGFAGNVLKDEFDSICKTILDFQQHRDRMVRRTVIELIPVLAKFYGERFNEKYLHKSINLILEAIKNGFERQPSFLALGELTTRVGQPIKKYVDDIFNVITEYGLKIKKKNFCEEALTCISDISKAVGETVSVRILHLLPSMFAGGLSTALIQSLTIISKEIPALLQPIQKRVLDTISQILARQPFNTLNPVTPPTQFAPHIEASLYSTPTIVFALKTLGSFNVKGHNLIDFVHDCVVKYLDDDIPAIRKEAAKTCCRLLVSQGKPPVKGHFGSVVGDVLAKLLIVGITDTDFTIRYAVLSSLEPKFDHYLALSDNLRSLFIALNDEVFEIREVAISIIGRLSIRNPAFVLPSLRKALLQLLTELEYSQDSRSKEESARMLGHLIVAAPRLIKPYVSSVLKVLMERIKDNNPNVSSCVLDTTGKLAEVGGMDIVDFIDDLLPSVIETLQDQSSSVKRAMAVKTLGQIVASTGYVITPYIKYPNLLTLLLAILKSEEDWSTRREIIKVLGIIGAIDPYQHKVQLESSKENMDTSSDIIPGLSPSSEEYYPTVAFNALIRILTDPSLSLHHLSAIQAVMYIFTSLNMKCVPFLPQVMPPFLNLIRNCEPNIRNTVFQQLSLLVSIVKQHIRNYLDEIFVLIHDFWNSSSSDTDFKEQIISLEEEICTALNEQFKPYLPDVIPQLLSVLQTPPQPKSAKKALHALIVFGRHLEEYLYLVVPIVVKLFEAPTATPVLKKEAIRCIGKLSRILNFSEYSSRIIHPLSRVLKVQNTEIRQEAMDTLCNIIHQLGSDFSIFIPMVTKVLTQYNITHQRYNELIFHLLKGLPLPNMPEDEDEIGHSLAGEDSSTEIKKMAINQNSLRKAWEASQRATKDDWIEWNRGFSVELLKESPSPALRSCSALAQVYHPLTRELFNAGFVSCWSELDDKAQNEVVRALEMAFSSPDLPPEVLQTLLNLAEFMEHDENPLPIAISALGALAEKCQCFAKALHYKEIEFQQNPSALIEDLISINNQLQQHEAAMGILKYAQKNHSIELKESWYEKLQRWKEAYDAYSIKQKQNPYDQSLTLGKMRCLKAIGEWEKLFKLCQDSWNTVSDSIKEEMAPMAAAAAWNLGEWESMRNYVNILSEDTSEGAFFRAILAIHQKDHNNAQILIDNTRKVLDTELAALVGESYNRAYDIIVTVQQLSEMEEIIRYQRAEDEESKSIIHQIWIDRLAGCKRNVEHWQNILSVRKLVIPERQDLSTWLKFASICRKSNKIKMSEKILQKLVDGIVLSEEPEKLLVSPDVHPKISYEYFKHMWSEGKQMKAFELMNQFVYNIQCDNQLKARACLTLGQWQKVLYRQHGGLDENKLPQILSHFKAATDFDKEWYKAWHEWALLNSEVVSHVEKKQSATRSMESMTIYLISALTGFFNSINLSPDRNSSLQDILRLLTLWFKHGAMKEIEKTLVDGFNTVSIDTWLEVIPQIIARVNSHVGPVRKLIHKLLSKVGKVHPQALVYPLTVCSYSQSTSRKKAAESLLNSMRQNNPVLVEQALMVSHELIRVAILWNELWHEGLEEASRLYFGEHDTPGMLNTLKPLHEMIQNPETLSEIAFTQGFGRDLQDAWEYCKKYQKTRKEKELSQAWDLYYHVFRRINKQLPHMMKLELQIVSPKLLEASDLELAIPGTYKSGQQVIRIASFARQLRVISSKQRPRKLKIFGSDGNEYQFLLKGHEDLRQDERVMQLFGLVNTLLKNDPETSTRDLSIKRYSVIPLSSNAGLIGWVDNCDTLHALIKEFRDSRNVLLNIEHRLMQQMAVDYDNLTLMQKIEVFEYALENTTGQDLYKVLWLKSRNSEVWLERRTNYTRSLAVMSIVGYILGLGDRHPSNLMLEKSTGKIVHIDFGDCFEVAMHRDKFPEKVPFRLTRMLINAMEVCGIEGTFKSTCESVMRVLRDNKDSVMAMLEAFVHDPLINWRLLETQTENEDEINHVQNQSMQNMSHNIPQDMNNGDSQDNGSPQTVSSYTEHDSLHYPSRSVREKNLRRTLQSDESEEESLKQPEALNQRALTVSHRIESKLIGRDFVDEDEEEPTDEEPVTLNCSEQVELLIEQATSNSNLCQMYIGWCAFW
ncbi:hypothetical protein C9374_005516 [Naegleria lovaniensis]|uniref:Serine/threonine-protein kinase TOR n=1 Tax=Naegleria lovaniensis TaxID=51637 RepID=A0AA88GNJ1_NAELO|nr:uncharacterized protein C9374_005516 [Naegleria lovaniensis]KAG2382314.1 hypothetical protein C9374_005516 [Naegleria lovaniensis]